MAEVEGSSPSGSIRVCPTARRSNAQQAARRRGHRRLAAACATLVLTVALLVWLAARAGDGPARGKPSQPSGAALATDAPAVPRALQTPGVDTVPITPPRPGRARILVSGAPASGQVALTFDDGFCAACVAQLVDVLRRTRAHATLFPNGTYAASWNPQARRIRAMIATGQVVVANHTFSHRDARTQSPQAFGDDLDANERWIQRTFGVTGRPWFRPPYGAYDAATLAVAGAQGYTRVVLWSGTLADSTRQTIPYLLKATRDWGHPGTIILAHGNYPNTARALPRIIALLARRHLRLVTLAELDGATAGREGQATLASPAIPAR